MVAPYGKAKTFEDDRFNNTLEPARSEWLRRPLVAISEMLSTFAANKDIMKEYLPSSVFEKFDVIVPPNYTPGDISLIDDKVIDDLFQFVMNMTGDDLAAVYDALFIS